MFRNLSRPSYFPVMVEKALTRLWEGHARSERRLAEIWCRERVGEYETLFSSLDEGLWRETRQFADDLRRRSMPLLQDLDVAVGGGGDYRLLYFLTRLLCPDRVLETGVAAGFSSVAILTALERNGRGVLHSSDFPYLRLDRPERVVGLLVPEDLRDRWHLYLDGDRRNLRRITAALDGRIDLFHYDSDKSRRGRAMVLHMIQEWLAPDSVCLMDDVGDNLFFRDYARERGLDARVFSCGGKYVGAIGLDRLAPA